MLDPQLITDELRGQFRGRLHFDRLARSRYATDASPFEIEPLAVAIPEDEDSLAALVRYCHTHALPIIPRGAGTGLSGETLGAAVILDLSVHFRQILAIQADTVTVQPGVVLEQLNSQLAKIGRRFAPDPASAATCTLGGMIATNASGSNAFRHGYTRDYIAGLGVVWDNGDRAWLEEGTPTAITTPTDSRTTTIGREVTKLLAANAERIAQARPRTPFDRGGYQLHGVAGPNGIAWPKLLAGSEGTLAIITAAKLRTVPLAGGTCLTLLGFPTLDAAVRAGLALRTLGPVACDLLDRRLLSVTRTVGVPGLGAALVVTFEADTERIATERTWGAIETLRRQHILRVLAEPTCTPDGIAAIQQVREAAVSGLYASGGPRPLPFIEDVGVPAEALPEYLTGVHAILKRLEISGTFLIHTLTGQVHTRPLLDLHNPTDRAKLWPLAEAVHTLAITLGGTISTQHGTGIARTPWVERQYGSLASVFRELKAIFDPKGILNPGKIVGPDPSREAWPLRRRTAEPVRRGMAEPASNDSPSREATKEGPFPLLIWRDTSPAQEVARCTGCGDCRTRSPQRRMCPAFRATSDEAASPRAMANLLRVLVDPQAATADEIWTAAEWCVNCKMCRDECDARINIPKLMLETKARIFAEVGLDRADWFLARIETWAAVGSNFAPVVNFLLRRPSARWLLEKLLGLARQRKLPTFALRNFFRKARGAGLTRKSRVEREPNQPRVALFVDLFAAYNDPLIGLAAVAVLKHHGIAVYVPRRQASSGIAPLVRGDLDSARDIARSNVRLFANLVREGYRIVCLEPTSALMFKQDYLDLLDDPDAALVAAHTTEIMAYLGELFTAGKLRTDFRRLDVTLGHHIPCHMKALRGPVVAPQLLGRIPGVRVQTIDVGCSGMAGTWGLKATNYAASLAAGAALFSELDRPRVLLGSTECSACRLQMEQGSGKRTLHPIQYLAFAYGLLPEIEARLQRPWSR
ncbi:MAG: FAD-linked oxidase C-terminal domain-containing protein [Gemmataceae bacterium]|nr:FAD-binding protein [Gemmata sp.]MDW8198293.1 FAD-linked oxidase C-terminal domain-containing protein [Gemmataceae bacterium]